MNLDFFIKNAPDITTNQVKNALIKVAKENNIPDATKMNVLVNYNKEQIWFMPHFDGKEVNRIPLRNIIDGTIGNGIEVLLIKIWRNESKRHNLHMVFINFMMRLQPDGTILVWPYHQGVYGEQMSIDKFLSL